MAKTIPYRKPALLLLALLCTYTLRAQNLVPNPGFEQFTACPNFPLITFCQSWTVPTNHMGSPDYFNTCATTATSSVPSNYMGYQWPATGNAYMGIILKSANPNFREYIQAQFTSPMLAGETYHISLKCTWAVLGTGPFPAITTDGIGFYLSQTPVGTGVGTNPIAVTPQYNPTVTLDSTQWTEIGFDYAATGGETYLLIGNYKTDAALSLGPVSDAYVYIDDVSVDTTHRVFVLGDTLLCLGETTTLTGYNSGTYAWADALAPNTIVANGPTLTVSPTVTTTYYLYTPADTDTVTVHIYPNPTVNAGPDLTVCPQQTVTLGATGATDYVWSHGVVPGTAFTPPMATTQYVVTGTIANGCADTDTITVTVQQAGCANFPNAQGCDVDAIRQAFTAAGCMEMPGCVDACGLYFFNPQGTTGTQAQALAQSLGANLVTIGSATESACIVSALNQLSVYNRFWIGLNDIQTEGTFAWYDQSPVGYLNWALYPTPQPDNETFADPNGEDCVQFMPGLGWMDYPCNGFSMAGAVIEVNLCPTLNPMPDVSFCGGSYPLQAGNTAGGSPPYTYTWSNGAQGQGINIPTPPQPTDYRVNVQDRYGCTAGDTVRVSADSPLSLNLGNDTTICQAENLLLVAYQGGVHVAGTQYLWHNGNTTPFFTPTQTGTYWVSATLNGCTITDTIQVTMNPAPAVNLGADGPICQGQTLVLDATVPNAAYQWQDNTTTPTYTVQQAGTYSVTVSVGNCTATDSVTFTLQAPPNVYLGNDATLCTGTIVTLDATVPDATYLWQNGSTAPTLVPALTGLYWVQVTLNGCAARDSINLLFLPKPWVNLGNDTIACTGSTFVLDATAPGYAYQWHDGSTSPTHTVNQAGTYGVQVTDAAGCQNTDAVQVTYIAAPQFSFVDSSLCKGDTWLLDITTPSAIYLWQDKSTQPTYTIHGEGTYWALATNPCGSASDTTEVEYRNCECNIHIPNSFSPNGDYRNERFVLLSNPECGLTEYTLSIFNRWGETVFETRDMEFFWDGTLNGKTLPADVYVYRIAHKFQNGPLTYRWGHISLVR